MGEVLRRRGRHCDTAGCVWVGGSFLLLRIEWKLCDVRVNV